MAKKRIPEKSTQKSNRKSTGNKEGRGTPSKPVTKKEIEKGYTIGPIKPPKEKK